MVDQVVRSAPDRTATSATITTPSGATVLDIGQNISRWMR
jgi:hypothetical protein